MMLDLVSKFDRFSGSSFMVSLVYWGLSLAVLIVFLNGSSYWMVMNWTESFVLGLLSFDPASLRESRAFSDPGYSLLVCSAWLIVGFTGFLSLCPYYDDMARDPAFIYSVTMVLWWYAMLSYGLASFRHFWYSLFLSSKSATYFMLLLSLEVVSWFSRGLTFGARFVVSGMFGTGVSYALASYFTADVDFKEKMEEDMGVNIEVNMPENMAAEMTDEVSEEALSKKMEEDLNDNLMSSAKEDLTSNLEVKFEEEHMKQPENMKVKSFDKVENSNMSTNSDKSGYNEAFESRQSMVVEGSNVWNANMGGVKADLYVSINDSGTSFLSSWDGWLKFGWGEFLFDVFWSAVVEYVIVVYDIIKNIEYLDIFMVFLTLGWNFYEMAMVVFQCYLIGLLGICFCVMEPMGYSNGQIKESDIIELKRDRKIKSVLVLWEQFLFSQPVSKLSISSSS
uniref:ATP synthase subunit 6 n=1 Tax=Tridacna derasa TaxID=80831 RepID=A0A3G3C722_TRIDE|nr:ATP synthase F0 subunit 6 [Tridacna derasa]AYP72634.1 ATP synthase subunit 6 [Tridacna derasa]